MTHLSSVQTDGKRELMTIKWVLLAAIAISIVHYADNYLNFDDYVDKTLRLDDLASGGTPAFITKAGIPVSWVLFTAAAGGAYLLLRRGRRTLAAALLGLYSISGLIGVFHYADVPPGDFDLYQNVFIISDTLLGIAVAVMAFRIATTRTDVLPTRESSTAAS